MNTIRTSHQLLLNELSHLIEQSKRFIATHANSILTMMFWNVGKRINEDILKNKRADYGKQIVTTLSTQLSEKYGRNFEKTNLSRMMRFAQLFPDERIVATLSQQLSWSHFKELIPLKTDEERLFYATETANRSLGVRQLRQLIERKTFERAEIANLQFNFTSSSVPFNTFKDPYLLDFLNLPKGFHENELEDAILKELERFILEMGKGFAFIDRQKRMIIDNEDFYLDLLFFHRGMKRLVAIELKLGKFHAKDKGQMELYLKWLNRYERQEGESEPIGLLLCTQSSREQVELLELHKDGIMVAEYWTELPPKKLLEQKIREIVIETKERFERTNLIPKDT